MLTAARLRELLTYEPETGIFTNLISRNSRAMAGWKSGHPNSIGYINIWIDGECYLGHRLAWLYVTGEWPTNCVDHKNGCRSDNSWSNLRAADRSQNGANKPGRTRHGLKGIAPVGDKWQAQIKHRGKRYVMNGFSTAEEAHQAYMNKARQLHGEFARA